MAKGPFWYRPMGSSLSVEISPSPPLPPPYAYGFWQPMDLRLGMGHFFGKPPSLNHRFLFPKWFQENPWHCTHSCFSFKYQVLFTTSFTFLPKNFTWNIGKKKNWSFSTFFTGSHKWFVYFMSATLFLILFISSTVNIFRHYLSLQSSDSFSIPQHRKNASKTDICTIMVFISFYWTLSLCDFFALPSYCFECVLWDAASSACDALNLSHCYVRIEHIIIRLKCAKRRVQTIF